MSNHAIIIKDGYSVPLIGIPADSVLDECDRCHDTKGIRELEWTVHGKLNCKKCRDEQRKDKP